MNDLFTFSAASLLIVNLDVKSLSFTEKPYILSPKLSVGNISLKASPIGLAILIKALAELNKDSMKFSLPDGFVILFTNSSIDMLPSLRPLFNSFKASTLSSEYPAASLCLYDILFTFSVSLLTDSDSISAFIFPLLNPFFKALSNEPSSSIILLNDTL